MNITVILLVPKATTIDRGFTVLLSNFEDISLALSLSLSLVNSIGLVKPEKAQSVERMLIRMAQTGQIQGKVSIIVVVY